MYLAKGDTPCRVNDPKYWFADRDESKNARIAKAFCKMCPERKECLAATLRFERREGLVQPAIFGGKTESERRSMLSHPAGTKIETA